MKQLRGTDLKRFLRDWRRASPPDHDIALVLQSVSYPANVGSLFRIADAVRVSKMFLCSATPLPTGGGTIKKVGRDKDRTVDWYYEERAETAVEILREEGYHICALEITDSARPYYAFDYPQKLALVIGNEDHGISRGVLDLCHSSVFIPMYGKGSSLNVHVSAAVVLYHILASRCR